MRPPGPPPDQPNLTIRAADRPLPAESRVSPTPAPRTDADRRSPHHFGRTADSSSRSVWIRGTMPSPIGDGAARPEGVHLGHMAHDRRTSQPLVLWLIGVQAANAAFDAIALYPIGQSTRLGKRAKQWAKDDLDRLGFPERFRFVFPIVKAGSVGGLLLGLRWRALGRLTGAAVVTYFVAALGFHARAKDPVLKYVPAAGMLGWSSLALRSMTSPGASR